MMDGDSEDVIAFVIFVVRLFDSRSLLCIDVSNVAATKQPIDCVLHHVLGILSIIPDCKAFVKHLFDAVLGFILKVPPECWC